MLWLITLEVVVLTTSAPAQTGNGSTTPRCQFTTTDSIVHQKRGARTQNCQQWSCAKEQEIRRDVSSFFSVAYLYCFTAVTTCNKSLCPWISASSDPSAFHTFPADSWLCTWQAQTWGGATCMVYQCPTEELQTFLMAAKSEGYIELAS